MNFCYSLFQIPGKTLAEKAFLGSLLLLILIIPFDQGGNGHILQFITRLLLLLCATVWAMQTIRRGTLTLNVAPIDFFVLGFVIWSLVSVITTPYKYATILEVIKILTYVALFYLCRMLFPLKRSHKTLLLTAILGSSLLQLLVTVYFALVLHSPKFRAGFVNPNNLACFWGFGITIAFSVVLFSHTLPSFVKGGRGGFLLNNCVATRGCGKLALSLLAGCLIIAILGLKSRGAMISVAGTGMFLTTLRKKIRGIFFVVLLFLLLIIPTPWGSGIQRLLKLDDPYAYQRIGIWKSSVRMIADHPVFGVGPGMYRYYGRAYNFPLEHQVARYAKMPNVAHNDLLQIGAESGIIGLLLVLGGIGCLVYSSCRQLGHRPISWQIAAASAGLLGLLIQGLFSHLLASPAIAIVAVVLGVILLDKQMLLQSGPQAPLPAHEFRTRQTWFWYAALLLIFACIFVFLIYFPTVAHIHYLKFYEYFGKQDYAAAVQHLTSAIRHVPIHAYYHHDLGTLYATAFQNRPDRHIFQQGSQEFAEAIRLNPINYEHVLALAELREAMFRQAPTKSAAHDALRGYRRALQYNPFDPFIRYAMASLYVQIEEADQAIAILQEAVAIEPNFVGGHQLLGDIFTSLQRHQEAEQTYRQADHIVKQYNIEAQNTEYAKALLRSNE